MSEFKYTFQVKEHHLDTFGHVNNATYLSLYEEARWDFISQNGYGLKEIMSNKKGPVVLEANIKFRKELVNREQITIHSFNPRQKNKIMWLTQRMINADGEICSEAEFTFGFMDLKERKLIDPSQKWLSVMGL